jgi:hypothetical protein
MANVNQDSPTVVDGSESEEPYAEISNEELVTVLGDNLESTVIAAEDKCNPASAEESNSGGKDEEETLVSFIVNEEPVARGDNLESSVNSADNGVPDYNDWAIVHRPKSKFHDYPCQMKGLVDSDTRRANIYVIADGKYELHNSCHVRYKLCRLMTQEEIEVLRSALGDFPMAFRHAWSANLPENSFDI